MMKKCPDCQVEPNQLHLEGCDVERCPRCGAQAIFCGHDAAERRMPWTGEWPGHDQCRELGWYARFVDNVGWVRCAADAPGATGDLNRLLTECAWDQQAQRWRRKA